MTTEPPPPVRYEATIHPGRRQVSLDRVAAMDLDRLPGPPDEVHVLLTADEAAHWVARGFEVRLLAAFEPRPLDASAVMDDDTALRLLEEQVEGVEREGSD